MPTENYSHIMMENKHMVGGDAVDNDGCEESLEIHLSGVKNGINQTPKNEDRGGGGTLVHEKLGPPGGVGFQGYIRTWLEGEAESTSEAQTGVGGAVTHLGRATWARWQATNEWASIKHDGFFEMVAN
jgi:hypothetical protein